jgi:hypothetical protein
VACLLKLPPFLAPWRGSLRFIHQRAFWSDDVIALFHVLGFGGHDDGPANAQGFLFSSFALLLLFIVIPRTKKNVMINNKRINPVLIFCTHRNENGSMRDPCLEPVRAITNTATISSSSIVGSVQQLLLLLRTNQQLMFLAREGSRLDEIETLHCTGVGRRATLRMIRHSTHDTRAAILNRYYYEWNGRQQIQPMSSSSMLY